MGCAKDVPGLKHESRVCGGDATPLLILDAVQIGASVRQGVAAGAVSVVCALGEKDFLAAEICVHVYAHQALHMRRPSKRFHREAVYGFDPIDIGLQSHNSGRRAGLL